MSSKEFNWAELDLTKVKTQFKASDIGTLDAAKLRVMAFLLNKTLTACVQTALYTYISRNWSDAQDRLTVEAQLRGMSSEELFNAIVNELPIPLTPYSATDEGGNEFTKP
jgi:hypothetical protein